MPANSLFADIERPTPQPSAPPSSMDDQRALQLALELSLLGINEGPNGDHDPFNMQGMTEAERASKRSANMTECVAVPSSEHVAEIVGRQGCKIKALRAKTNTYIKTPVRGEEPVFVVTGRKEDVGMAKREILSAAEHFSQIRACRKNNLNGSMAPGPPTNIPGQVTIQVRVPYRVVGLVVGPKGATIKRIQQQTHTYIVTPSRDKEPVFEVTGLPESVEQARKEIEAHIAMRTGGLMDQEPDGMNSRHDFSGNHSLENLFSSSELVSSLYKLNNNNMNGLNGIGINGMSGNSINGVSNGLGNTLSSLNMHNNLNSSMGGSLNNTLNNSLQHSTLNNTLHNTLNNLGSLNPSLGDMNFLMNENNSNNILTKPNIDASLFASITGHNSSSGKMMDMNGSMHGSNGIGNMYNVDEGLGSLGSSMGSSPSFDPNPSSIWGDIGRSIGTSLHSTVHSSGSLSSTFSSLTRRSSSVSAGASPPSRLSPSIDQHQPARRISSDPAPGSATFFGGLASIPSSNSSPASTPELNFMTSTHIHSGSSMGPLGPIGPISSKDSASNSTSSSPPPNSEKRCRTCNDSSVVAALIPCGHNLFCMECANKLVAEERECPSCHQKVTQAIRIFSS